MHPNRKLANNRSRMSYPEKVAYDHLTSSGIEFQHQFQIDKFFPDFVIGNKIIEIDGAKWHDAEKDKARDKILTDLGYTVYRIDSKENIISKINTILQIGE